MCSTVKALIPWSMNVRRSMAPSRRRFSWAEEDRIAALLKRCVNPLQLNQIHAHLVATGHSQNNFLIAQLLRSFTHLHCLHHARRIADTLRTPNAFVWTALIRASPSHNHALLLYTRMHRSSNPLPLPFTLSSLLKACSSLSQGMQLHAHAFKYAFQTDPRVQTTLVHFYSNCRLLDQARTVFDGILTHGGHRDVQAWNTIIAGYAAAGDMENARSLFDRMPDRNSFTWVAMITGYAASGQMDLARTLFHMAPPGHRNAVVCTTMITAYAKCGDLPSARAMFDDMTERDVASWNAMISACTHAHLVDEALDLFRLMLNTTGRCKVDPNQVTIATVVSACARSGSPRLARGIHEYVESRGSSLLNTHTVAALIDMHCKCGDLSRAYNLFRGWKHKDLICYSSMISGFGIHGHGQDAIGVFDELKAAGLKPDAICFISVLTACSHAGMLDEGRRYLEEMRSNYGIAPRVEHYMCVVDLLGRSGYIEEAYKLITEEMVSCGVLPNAGVWGALLSACRTYGNVELGEAAMTRLIELEPENAGNYVLMSNIYARAVRWEGVAMMRAEMRRRGIGKPPAWSWIETGDRGAQRFLTDEIVDVELEMVLDVLGWELKAEGYFPVIEELE